MKRVSRELSGFDIEEKVGGWGWEGVYITEDGVLDEISFVAETGSSCHDLCTRFLALLKEFQAMRMLKFIRQRSQHLSRKHPP